MKRKIISLLATAAILTSGLVMSVSAAQSNMEVNVPRFSTEPTFDGCVSKEEWGEPTAHVVTEGAATVDDDTQSTDSRTFSTGSAEMRASPAPFPMICGFVGTTPTSTLQSL